MDEITKIILASGVVAAVVSGLFQWKINTKVESLKNELQTLRDRNQFKYTHTFDKMADAIAEIFALHVVLMHRARSFRERFPRASQFERDQLTHEVEKANNHFIASYLGKSIYIPSCMDEDFSRFAILVNEFRQLCKTEHSLIERGQLDETFNATKYKLDKMENDMTAILYKVRQYFSNLLGLPDVEAKKDTDAQ